MEAADSFPKYALEVKGVSLRSPDKTFLSDIFLRVDAGEFLAILGRSGSGKSTLLRVLLGLPFPSSWLLDGTVRFFGKKKSFHPARTIQPVFQDSASSFNPVWTMEASLSEPLRLFREENEYSSLLQKWLPVLGLEEKDRNRLPSSFSGGELQRFALLRALVCRPKILLLDEATSALDPILNSEVLSALSRLRKEEGTTILWVTHNVKSASKFCTRIGVMDAGKLVEEGPSREIFLNPREKETRLLFAASPGEGRK
ncbi:ABC transporter, ATP-binding protein [Leptospira inadai serovar Lyme str. 10]|uniref:ABC transporter, ATP-binding protein n=2 Tax=Leptospira inadai serovar Lyme TaxID=293084 RepID=V6HMA2_9LEPT|nr:ABC transporter ATP-binding protein [Leptospira inadai]EQA38015.1 ABC transporter, ATP-binding protein [Leptospira inadai serovar Lyme str. 10]PNV74726.1 ABC transporter ATP-binding protein [Leptospira inadai serovar Lyme]